MTTTIEKNEVNVENLGPIKQLNFALKEHGITVLSAPNGSGKSILLDALKTSAKGSGKLPLRDHATKGKLEAFGATISIGGTTRHKGEFEVTHLEGRFDLAELVDPMIKSPVAADAKRIKALVSLTGVKADIARFREHPAFADVDDVVDLETLTTDDFVEMARLIKSSYETKAREKEAEAIREQGHAEALSVNDDVDLNAESDSELLSQRYDEKRDALSKLNAQKEHHSESQARLEEAKKTIESLGSKDGEQLEEISTQLDSILDAKHKTVETISKLKEELRTEQERYENYHQEEELLLTKKENCLNLKASREAAQATIDSINSVECPSEEALQMAAEELDLARDAIEAGALIRKLKEQAVNAKKHKNLSEVASKESKAYRKAAQKTDDVLSSAITCESLAVELDGDNPRLVVKNHQRGESTPYAELSEGERWKIAIDLGAERVGKEGLLVIPQTAYEGLDTKNRILINDHAAELGVYILTAEAAKEEDAEGIVAKTF